MYIISIKNLNWELKAYEYIYSTLIGPST